MAHARTAAPERAVDPGRPSADGGLRARAGAGRSKRPRSGSRSTPRRCASGATGSWPKATPGCRTVSSRRTAHRAGPPERVRRQVLRLRRQRRWGADHIAYEIGLAASTVQSDPERRRLRPPRPGRPGHRRRAGAPLPAGPAGRADPRRRQEDRRRSRTAAAGGSTAAATTPPRGIRGPATATSTPRSMTAPGSSTPRSTTTNKPSPPPGSGTAPPPGSRRTGSAANGC